MRGLSDEVYILSLPKHDILTQNFFSMLPADPYDFFFFKYRCYRKGCQDMPFTLVTPDLFMLMRAYGVIICL